MVFVERLFLRGVVVFLGMVFGDYFNFIRIFFLGKGFERGLRVIREELECVLELWVMEGWEGFLRGVLVEGLR